MILAVEPEALTLPVFISSSDNEHFDDLAYAPPQAVSEVEIAHSLKEANDSDTSSSKTNMVKFKTLDQKKIALATNPLVVAAPPISQVPLPTINTILELTNAIMRVGPNTLETPLLDKRKEEELTVGTSKRSKKKAGEMNSTFLSS